MARLKSFTYPFVYHDLLERAVQLAIGYSNHPEYKEKVTFEGNIKSGSIKSAKVIGEYLVQEDTITITISKKPLVVPWKLIQKKMAELFETSYEEAEKFIVEAEKSLANNEIPFDNDLTDST